jgi:serine protease Do
MARITVPSVAAALGLLAVCLGVSGSAQAAPPKLPPLPGASPAASEEHGAKAAATLANAEQVRRGVVQIEHAGRPIGVGTVLSRDGRILTALSALGSAAEPEIRYADGTVVKTKIGDKDKAWDLALLVPQTGKWLDGLTPTDADPKGLDLRAFLPTKAGKLGMSVVNYMGRTDVKSKDGEPLRSVIDVDLKGMPTVPGAPIFENGGKVIGLLVKACKETPAPDKPDPEADANPATACAPVTVVAPVYALRSFLMKAPAKAAAPSAWLGLGGVPSDHGSVKGVRVMGLAPGSPAEKAGLKTGDAKDGSGGDVIVAVDGQPVETPEQLAGVIAKRAIGQTVKLLVFSGGKFREAAVTLRAAP